jgi:tRNA threonylcarbamoyladenosine biosynthesis protein TsaE
MKLAEKTRTPDEKTVVSRSPEETERIGVEIARRIPVPGVVLLRGDLGSGKTTLTRGIARGLGLQDTAAVNSPSFTLVNIYQGNCRIYHVDLYRLQNDRDLYSIGMDDFLGQDGVTIVEWSERLSFIIRQAVRVDIEDAGGSLRILRIVTPGRSRRMKS